MTPTNSIFKMLAPILYDTNHAPVIFLIKEINPLYMLLEPFFFLTTILTQDRVNWFVANQVDIERSLVRQVQFFNLTRALKD